MNRDPMIKDLSDAGLVDAYLAYRGLAYNASQMQSRGLGRLLRMLDITVAVARKRGVPLPVSVPCVATFDSKAWLASRKGV